ncbi:MAG: HdeD family acid-resistance protein [Chloroflexi bacterium]|nr:HdeD family acid-resistance protein [Chloroflexota bacterium]
MLDTLSRNWWTLIIRGLVAVLFGLFAIFVPDLTLRVLVLLFGAYALVDGGINIYAALIGGDPDQRWWVGLLEGLVGVAAGILTFIWPEITALVLLYLIAFWAIFTGILEIWGAIQLRREINNEVLLGISGVLSIIFGALLIIAPGSGALAVTWLIGFYAILFGVMMIALGFRVRSGTGSGRQIEAY